MTKSLLFSVRYILFTLSIISISLTSYGQENLFAASGTGAVDWTMTSYDGESKSLSDEQTAGKVVLYDYFFTTCFYCGFSAPELEDIYTEWGPDGTNKLEIFSLDVKTSTHGNKSIPEYQSEFGITNELFDIKSYNQYYSWFYTPFLDPEYTGNGSYGLPHFIAVCPDGSFKSLYQDDVFPNSASVVNSKLREFLGSACPSVTLDIISLDAIDISIAPNPADDKITITYDEAIGNGNVALANVNGQIVYEGEIFSGQVIDVSSFDNGVYILTFSNGEQQKTEKIIIQ